MKNLAIIPARSGSKGLIDKNIKKLAGLPLMAYTIKSALDCGLFNEVMVSTDSFIYQKIAIEYGANVPFLRSETNSQDESSSWDVVKEVLIKYMAMDVHFDNVILLQPTSPLREKFDIIRAYNLFLEKNADFVASVCEVDHSPLLQNILPENLSLENFLKLPTTNLPRQSLPKFYRLNGAIYISSVSHLLTDKLLYNKNSYAFIMDKLHSVDIDDEFDFFYAEYLLSICKNGIFGKGKL